MNTNFLYFMKEWKTEPNSNLNLDVSEKTSEDILVTNSSRIQFFSIHKNSLSGIHLSLSTNIGNREEKGIEIMLLTTFADVSLCKIMWTSESDWVLLNRWSQIFQCTVYLNSIYLNLSILNVECVFPKEIITNGISIQRTTQGNFGLQLSDLNFMRNSDFEEMYKRWYARNSLCNSAVEPLMHTTCAYKFATPMCCGLVENFLDAECECAHDFVENSRNMGDRLEIEFNRSELYLFCLTGIGPTELNRNCMEKSIFLRKASIQLEPYYNLSISNISEAAQVQKVDLQTYRSYAPTHQNISYYSGGAFIEWLVGDRSAMAITYNQSEKIDGLVNFHSGARVEKHKTLFGLEREKRSRNKKRTTYPTSKISYIHIGLNLFMKPLTMVATLCIVFPAVVTTGYATVRWNKELHISKACNLKRLCKIMFCATSS